MDEKQLELIMERSEEILKELQLHSKLMENIFHKKDSTNHNRAKMTAHVKKLQEDMLKMPGMDNPEVQKMVQNIINIVPTE